MKNILPAVCGLSPQVITETLFALHQTGSGIDAIHIITTHDGREKIFGSLLAGGSGHFCRYLQEYGFDPSSIDFSPPNIHVVTDEYGQEISDIIHESDNEAFLGKCLELTFHFTRDAGTAVFFPVAGGRKTMSSCLSLAAQMYGRPQERIYHVLVSPEFESNQDFYYPPKESKTIELRDKNGQPYYKETRYAEINLVHLPFVSIRDRLSGDLLRQPLDPATLILSLIREERNRLVIDLGQGKIIYRGLELDMMPARLALYAFFALRKKACSKTAQSCRGCTDCFIDIGGVYEGRAQINEIYSKLVKNKPLGEMSDSGITNLSSDNFDMYKSKIKRALRNRFGLNALKELGIASKGRRPHIRYGICIDRGKIEFVDEPESCNQCTGQTKIL